MKQGQSFEELVARVEEDANRRCDLYCPTDEMHLMSDASGSRLATPSGQLKMRDRAHLHLAELCGIERRYYQRLRLEAPHLLDRNVNHWLTNNPPKQRIVRALNCDEGGEARAIVSSRYALLDNDALLRAIEPVIAEQDLTIESCDAGEDKLTLKMVSPRLKGDVQVGDTVQAGLMIRNSEVRCNAVEINWFVKRLVCSNGMVVTGPQGRGAFRRHVGRDWNKASQSPTGLSFGPIPDSTLRKQWEQAIWDELQNSLRNSLSSGAFTDLLDRLSLTTKLHTTLPLDEVAERVGNRFDLRPGEITQVIHHLSQDEDVARWGVSLWSVVNATTRTAEDMESYSRATELETLGGLLANQLSPKEWERLVSPN